MTEQRPRVEAVVFDLDDTLIDWWGSIERCLSTFAPVEVLAALQEHCRTECWELRPGSNDVWHRNTWALHHHRDRLWPAALGFLEPAERNALMRRFDDELWVEFFPDTISALEALGPLGLRLRLAVLSNNQHLPAEVERLQLDTWFELSVCAPVECLKPHPSAFGAATQALGLAPERCAYVGDSVRADVLGARDAGLHAVWLNRWGDAWPDRPGDIAEITTLAELPALLAPEPSPRDV